MKILHCADIHLGYDRHAKFNTQLNMPGRVADYKKAFDEMVQKGLAADIDLFLFCGDAFMHAHPSPTLVSIFAECLQPIAAAQIPIVALMGNHDTHQASDKRSSINWLKYYKGELHVFEEPTLQTIQTKSGAVQIIALPWINKHNLRIMLKKDQSEVELNQTVREEIVPKFIETLIPKTNPEVPLIVAGHFTLFGTVPFGLRLDQNNANQEIQFPVSHFLDERIDYVALGHIHNFKDLNEGKKPPVVYSGSIERTSFKEEDHPEKGFVLVEIHSESGKKNTKYQFIKLNTREMLSIKVDVEGIRDATEVILNEIYRHDINDKIVRVEISVDEQTGVIAFHHLDEALKSASYVDPYTIKKKTGERQNRSATNAQMSIEEGILAFVQDVEKWAPLKDEMITEAKAIEAKLASE